MAEALPVLLTLSEVADLFRSPAKNRARAGRLIVERNDLPTVEGHRPGVVLVPAWAVEQLIGQPTHCPQCGVPVGSQGCQAHPPVRTLAKAS